MINCYWKYIYLVYGSTDVRNGACGLLSAVRPPLTCDSFESASLFSVTEGVIG